MKWFDRAFPAEVPAWMAPNILERLRGTPARLEERIGSIPFALLTTQVESGWSIQENVGHLIDLELLWFGRVQELLAGRETLRPADLENRATVEAQHNQRSIEELFRRFREARTALVLELEYFRSHC